MELFGLSDQALTAIITMIGTIFAGAGLKAVDSWLSRASTKAKVDSDLREEYRDTISDKRKDIAELKADIEAARIQIDTIEQEVILWRDKYYEELQSKMELMARLRLLEKRYNGEE